MQTTRKNVYKLIGTIDPIIRRYCLKKDCYIDKTTYDILYKAEIQTIKNITPKERNQMNRLLHGFNQKLINKILLKVNHIHEINRYMQN